MISHRHKCIFIHIPKTAGTSINSFFHPGVKFHYKKPDYERLFGWCPERKLHMQHATSKQLIETKLVTEEQWETYFKFSFVRNPWDRSYSDYAFVKDFAKVKGSFKDYLNKEGEFKEIFTNNTNENYLGDHMIPQSDFIILEGESKIDFLGRFENFKNDIQLVLKKLAINEEFNEFRNSSKRKNDYSLFYTNSNMKRVSDLYSIDISNFNYSFDDNRKGFFNLKKIF